MDSQTDLRRPSDDLQVLSGQLLRELDRLDRDPQEAEPELCQAYLHHAQALAWYRVAEGAMSAPRDVLDRLGDSRSFVARHLPDLSDPAAATAAEIHFAISGLRVAEEALEQRRTEDRLASSRSETERAILAVLAAQRGTYLRRGQVHEQLQLPDPLSPARVGQILVELDEEGLLQRVHGRAQGNPNSAFYALSPRGLAICRDLGLVPDDVVQPAVKRETPEVRPGKADTEAKIDQAIRIAIDPASSDDRRRIATGTLTSSGMGGLASELWRRFYMVARSNERGSLEEQTLEEVTRQVQESCKLGPDEATTSPGTFRIQPPEPPSVAA